MATGCRADRRSVRAVCAAALLEAVAHLDDGVDGRQELAAELGELVLDRGWGRGHHAAVDDAVRLQPLEALGEHLRRDARDVAAQLVEPSGPSRRYQMTFGVQAPPRNDMHSVNGHSLGGGATRLGRYVTEAAMGFTKLPNAYWQLLAYHQLVT